MPRANSLNRTLDDLTVGELKAVLAGGDESATVAEALAVLTERTRVTAAHELDTRQHQAYVDRRAARRAAALAEAAAAADKDKANRRNGDGARMAARQAARLEADETFAQREPLLDFAEWVDRGRPDVHAVGAIRRAVKAAVTTSGLAH